jgi:hypothetical protein
VRPCAIYILEKRRVNSNQFPTRRPRPKLLPSYARGATQLGHSTLTGRLCYETTWSNCGRNKIKRPTTRPLLKGRVSILGQHEGSPAHDE